MIELYLVRHGETTMNEKGLYYGWTDCSLTAKGVSQAQGLNKSLGHIQFDAVITSTLCRAIDTASIISGLDVNEIITDDRLRELNFGEWEGMHYEELMEKHKEHWDKWCSDWMRVAPPSGECFEDLSKRVEDFVKELLDKHKHGKILIVAHLGSLRIISSLLIKLKIENCWSFIFEHGKYSVLEVLDSHCMLRKINVSAAE